MKRWLAYARRAGSLALATLALAYIVYSSLPGTTAPPPTGRETAAPAAEVEPTAERPIRIGWTAWADAEIVANLVERLLTERMGYEVELVMADIGIQYQGVATGDLDVMLMAWLPTTHRNYWQRVAHRVANLGPLYTGARLGWVVPAYVPEERLSSIADLADPAIQKRLGGRIQGIDPGSGLMQASERALGDYGLTDMELVSSSGAAMTAALARAVRRREWIVLTGWSPHWMFERWELRYLDDPKRAMGGRERVHAIARRGFDEDYPLEVTEFLTRLYIPLEDLQRAMLRASETDVGEAVDAFVRSHPQRIDYWLDGRLPAGGGE